MLTIRNSIRIIEAGSVSVSPVKGFDITAFLRQLRQTAIDTRRSHHDASPEGRKRKQACMAELFGLTKQGLQQAHSGLLSNREAAELVNQMKKVVATSGTALSVDAGAASEPVGAVGAAAPVIPKPSSIAASTGRKEMIFPDRLQRFVKKWEEGDPQWRLLQCATMKVGNEVRVLGFAETGDQEYSLFSGVSGGEYKTREVTLVDARNAMKTAISRGFTEIPARVLAAKIGVDHVANQQFSSSTKPMDRTSP